MPRPTLGPTLAAPLFSIGLLSLALASCDDHRSGDDAGSADGGARDAEPGDASADAGIDAGPLGCTDDRQIALDRDGPLTQIHASVAFDGEAIWVVYVRPEPGGGNFDVWATRVGCDGAAIVAPVLVQAEPLGNDIDPEVAISGDRVLIAWQTDDGTGGTDNLQVRYRLFDRDGTPRDAVDRTLRTSREGAPIPDNHSGVRLAVLPDGRFVAAGARGVPDVMRFQAYAQILSLDGDLEGDALEAGLEPMVTQSGVAVAAQTDGTIWIAYDRSPDGGSSDVFVRSFGAAPTGPELALEGLTSSGGADLLASGDAVWAAFSGETSIGIDLRILDVSRPLTERAPAFLGMNGRLEHSPRLAVAPDGSLSLAWFRQIRGFTNELLAARFAPGADPSMPPTVSASVLVEGSPGVPSYQPAIAHLQGDFHFVAFAIGASPYFRLVGRFVGLTP
jgi:hypothetical protein